MASRSSASGSCFGALIGCSVFRRMCFAAGDPCGDPEQEDGADYGRGETSEGSDGDPADQGEDPSAEDSADQSDDEVYDESGAGALDDQIGEPPGSQSDKQIPDKVHFSVSLIREAEVQNPFRTGFSVLQILFLLRGRGGAGYSGAHSAALQGGFEGPGELVGAGGALVVAVDSFEPSDHLADLHAADEGGYSPGISVTAAGEGDPADDTVLDLNINLSGAGSLTGVRDFLDHGVFGFSLRVANIRKRIVSAKRRWGRD